MIPLNAKLYEFIALAMRYFFTFMGVMIVWRSFSWLRKDRRQTHKRLKQLPDAGTIGILTVEQGSKELRPGVVIPVPHEGVLGYVRTCDVVIPVEDVATTHLDFTFVDGKGLYIYPRRGCDAIVDGIALNTRAQSRRYPMQHGSVLQIGQAVLRLGVFAGLDVKEARLHPSVPEYDYDGGEAYVPDLPETYPPPQSWAPPPYPPQPYQSPYQQPGPYPPVNPPSPQPYGQPPCEPPYQQPQPLNNPWQGGDGHA